MKEKDLKRFIVRVTAISIGFFKKVWFNFHLKLLLQKIITFA